MPTEFIAKLVRVGNSLRVVIPKPAADGLGWKQGTIVKITVTDSQILIRRADAAKTVAKAEK